MTNPPPGLTSPHSPAPRPTARLAGIIVAIVIGNGFVAYDFTVYSFYVAIIGRLFFPAANPVSSLLLSFATFGAGFVMRPVGALLIGRVADRRGRRAGMLLALVLMTLGTWTIACLPGYSTLGVTATVLMVAARLLQGLAAGGEIGPATASLMEVVPYRLRCFMVSWRGAGQGAAACIAALVGAALSATLTPDQMQTWGWRLPFVLGGLIGPVGWYLRRHMPVAAVARAGQSARTAPVAAPGGAAVPGVGRGATSTAIEATGGHAAPTAVASPSTSRFAHVAQPVVWGILMMAAPSVSVYLAVFYMPGYLIHTLHRPATISFLTACLSGLAIFLVTPLVGTLADRLPSRKTLQYAGLTAALAATWPAFSALTHGAGEGASVVIIVGYAAIALNNAGPASVLMLEAFPPYRRAAALAVIYGIGVVVFGGFTPFIMTWLIAHTGNAMMPAWYLMGANLVGLVALSRFPERDARTDAPAMIGA